MKKIKIQLSQQAAQELADLRIELGLAEEIQREDLIIRALKPLEAWLG